MIGFKGGALGANGKRKGVIPRFDAAVHYLLYGSYSVAKDFAQRDRPSRVSWLSTRNLPTEDPWHAVEMMKSTAWPSRNRVKEPGYHMGASLPPEESLDREQWEAVADAMLERLGLEKHQAVIALHEDRGHQHIHVIVNRVHLEGHAWKPSFDERKITEVMRAMERKLGLRLVPTHSALVQDPDDPPPPPPTVWSEQTAAARIGRVLDKELRAAESWDELDDLLAGNGLRLLPAKRGGGAVVREGEHQINLSKVDRTLSGVQLGRHFGESLRAYVDRRPTRPRLAAQTFSLELADAGAVAEGILEALSGRQATWTERDVQIHARHRHDPDLVVRLATEHRCVQRIAMDRNGEVRFASRGYLKDELMLFDLAERLRAQHTRALDPQAAGRAAQKLRHLSEEQQQAVLYAAAQSDLALIKGTPGSGKTTVLSALAKVHRDEGHEVVALSPTARGAQHLRNEAGIRARTVYGWRHGEDEEARTFRPGTVVLVDDVEQLASRELAQLLVAVERAGGKAILAGDVEGLQPIGPGAAFRGLTKAHDSLKLASAHRSPNIDLDELAQYDDLHWLPTREDAVQALAKKLIDHAEEGPEEGPEESRLAITATRAEAERVNRAVSELHRQRAEASEIVRVRDRTFGTGDRVRLTRGSRFEQHKDTEKIYAASGSLGTIRDIEERKLRIDLDDGPSIRVDLEQFDHLDHGYALNVHQTTGREVDRTYVLISERLDRHAARVAFSRHRKSAHLYADRETFPTDLDLSLKIDREQPKDLVSDHGRLAFGDTTVEQAMDLVRKLEAHQATWTHEDFHQLARGNAHLSDRLAEIREVIALPEGRMTTRRYLEQEMALVERARTLAARPIDQANPSELERIATTHDLSPEKRQALEHMASNRLALVTGRAGSGKTRLTRALVEHFEGHGQRVRGAAFTGKAAETLGQSAGIESQTLAARTIGWDRGEQHLGPKDVLIVDEASMVDVPTMNRVLREIERSGARVVLVGDPYQLPAIGAGDAFRALLERHPSISLEEVYRQRHAWQVEASNHAATGNLDEALKRYDEQDAIRFTSTLDQARNVSARTYLDQHRGQSDRALILADRRADVAVLNETIHDDLVQHGELHGGLRIRGKEFSIGDRIVLGANDPDQKLVQVLEGEGGVRNGSLGQITNLEAGTLTARLDDGRIVAFDPRAYQRFEHGYATTVHKAQGQTLDHTYYLARRQASRASTYVALTRHRESLTIFAAQSDSQDLDDLSSKLSRQRSKSLAMDFASPEAAKKVIESGRGHDITAQAPTIQARKPARPSILDERVRKTALETALTKLRAHEQAAGSEQGLAQQLASLQQQINSRAEANLRTMIFEGIEPLFRSLRDTHYEVTESFERQGTRATLEELARVPESFGKLKRSLFRNVRQEVQVLATRAAEQQAKLESTPRDQEQLSALEGRLKEVRDQLQAMDPPDQLRLEVGVLAQSITRSVIDELPAQDRSLVLDLRQEQKDLLKNIHQQVQLLRHTKPGSRDRERAQHAIVSLIRVASRHAVFRLSPPIVRSAIRASAILRMPKAVLYKLAPPHLRPVLYAASLVKSLVRDHSRSR